MTIGIENFFQERAEMIEQNMERDIRGRDALIHTRRKGTSTALALKAISDAMLYPGQGMEVIDHYNTPASNRHLALHIDNIIRKLGLQGFTVSPDKRTIIFQFEYPLTKKQKTSQILNNLGD